MQWRKSSYSSDVGDNCVELAARPKAVAIRDSKNPAAGHLTLTGEAFAKLIQRIKAN